MPNSTLEINRVSTVERICHKFTAPNARPVAFVVMGVDCDFKKQTATEISQRFDDADELDYRKVTDEQLKEFLLWKKRNIILLLDRPWSFRLGTLAARLRSNGATNVVGVYARPLIEHFVGDSTKIATWRRLEQCLSYNHDFDYLAPVTEDSVRILWSDTSEQNYHAAFMTARNTPGVSITDGTIPIYPIFQPTEDYKTDSSWLSCINWHSFLMEERYPAPAIPNVDVIINADNDPIRANKVTSLAIHINKPLISLSAGLSEDQEHLLREATMHVPVFYQRRPRPATNAADDRQQLVKQALAIARTAPGRPPLFGEFYSIEPAKKTS